MGRRLRAPRGKEVEELEPDEIKSALSKKVPTEEVESLSELSDIANELTGTLEALLLKKDGSRLGRVPVSELVDKLKTQKGVDIVLFDGIITGRLVDTAVSNGINTLVGERIADGIKIPRSLKVKVFKDL